MQAFALNSGNVLPNWYYMIKYFSCCCCFRDQKNSQCNQRNCIFVYLAQIEVLAQLRIVQKYQYFTYNTQAISVLYPYWLSVTIQIMLDKGLWWFSGNMWKICNYCRRARSLIQLQQTFSVERNTKFHKNIVI